MGFQSYSCRIATVLLCRCVGLVSVSCMIAVGFSEDPYRIVVRCKCVSVGIPTGCQWGVISASCNDTYAVPRQ